MTRAPRALRGSSAQERTTSILGHVLLALLAYVPILRTEPGIVAADTKSYLYLDPAKLLSRALTMWDPNVGMGTLTHQTIGYLFPMGPWYWVFERLGFPDWVAQRLWLASVIFAASAGMLFLARTLRWGGVGPIVAALAYGFSPYVLDYSARISVILLPWAALPWLVALAQRALARGGWRHPALFALVVLSVGGVNATALVFAGIAPVLWFPFAVWVNRDASLGRAIATMARIGGLTSALCVWWVVGLAVQGGYGIPILRYTETIETVARTSLSSEVLRGLGYWFFYGNDKLGPWIEPAVDYTQKPWLIVVGFAIPTLALAGMAVLRWRHRAYAACLIVVGTVIAVGAHAYDDPSPLGRAFKSLATTSTVGLALRSTPRAIPLISLGMALLLGATVTALRRRVPATGLVGAAFVMALVLAGLPPLFTGDLAVGEFIKRPEELPSYWPEAAAYLDTRGDETRVLELPGTDFASYRWGNTIDPITPYLMDRPYVARELIPYGTPGTADLLNALDRRIQEGVFEASSLAPVARLMRAGDIVLRNDLLTERYRTPRPRVLWNQLAGQDVAGIGRATEFGPSSATRPSGKVPVVDEHELAVPSGSAEPPAVGVLAVSDAPSIVASAPGAGGFLVAGDGEGLVELAAAGLLDAPEERAPIRYAASLTGDRAWTEALDGAGTLVVTDSNRKRARRWGTVRENTGFTETAAFESLRDDPTDARLDLFPEQTAVDQTVAEPRGVRAVRSTRYGNPVSYTPEDRAANAFDGALDTAWRVGAFAKVEGERLRIDLSRPGTFERVRLVQPQTGPRNRIITRIRLHFDRPPRGDAGPTRQSVEAELGPESLRAEGQEIRFAGRRFRSLDIEILSTNFGIRPKYDGQSGVGFAEVDLAEADLASVRVDEVVRLPTELLARAGDRWLERAVAIVVSRQRSSPADPARGDEEPSLVRTFSTPTPRSFTLAGTARVAPTISDEEIDRLLGVPGVADGGTTARSDGRLPGDLRSRASAALDGDPATAWQPGLLAQPGHWLEAETASPLSFDHLDLAVVADGRHSVPTRVRLEVDGGSVNRFLDLPAIDDDPITSVATIPFTFEAVSGRRFRLTVEEVRAVSTPDFFSGTPLDLPVAIAELGIPGLRMARPASAFATECRDDLVRLEGATLPVRLTGTSAALEAREGLAVEACQPLVDLSAGSHDLRSAAGRRSGIDIDRLVLQAPATGTAKSTPARRQAAPRIRVQGVTRTSFDLLVERTSEPYWLVLGQSHNLGWRATVNGRRLDPPVLVDGYANGWRMPPSGAGPTTVRLEWTPQRSVWGGLALSAVALVLCVGIVVFSSVRCSSMRRRRGEDASDSWLEQRQSLPSFLRPDLRRPLLVTPLLVGAAFALSAGPAVGIVSGVLVALAIFVPPARWLVAFGGAIALAASGAYVAGQQVRYRYPPDFAWPTNTERAHVIGWLAVALTAAAVLHRRLDVDNPDEPDLDAEESLKSVGQVGDSAMKP